MTNCINSFWRRLSVADDRLFSVTYFVVEHIARFWRLRRYENGGRLRRGRRRDPSDRVLPHRRHPIFPVRQRLTF